MRLATIVLTFPFLVGACREAPRSTRGTQAPVSPATTTVRLSANADSTLISQPDSAGLKRYRIVKHRLIVADAQSSPIFLRETSDQHCCLDGERRRWGTIQLERLADSSAQQAKWHIVVDADTGALWGPFYRAVFVGCCDAANELLFVSIKTGEVTFVSSQHFDQSSDLLSVTEPSSRLTRYFGFHDRYTEAESPEARTDAAVVGVLEYGLPDGPVARVTVRKTSGSAVDYRLQALKVSLNGIERESASIQLPDSGPAADSPATSACTINIYLTNSHTDEPEDVVIHIPVQGDRLRLDLATVPPGFTLTRSQYKTALPGPPA